MRVVLIVVAATVSTVALAACGGSSGNSKGKAAAAHNDFVAFSVCMRHHGLTGFPDPTVFQGHGVPSAATIVVNGYEFKLGAGLDPQSPAFQAAAKACGGL